MKQASDGVRLAGGTMWEPMQRQAQATVQVQQAHAAREQWSLTAACCCMSSAAGVWRQAFQGMNLSTVHGMQWNKCS